MTTTQELYDRLCLLFDGESIKVEEYPVSKRGVILRFSDTKEAYNFTEAKEEFDTLVYCDGAFGVSDY